MADNVLLDALYRQLFSAEALVYAVLDGASVPNLPQALRQHGTAHLCLYRGELEPDLAQAAPYLVALEPQTAFTDWLLEQGWGGHWGIFAVAQTDLRLLARHFRTFLMVYDPTGRPLYFRYYDPRVLRVYLPTCTTEETQVLFGPVQRYLVEDEDPQRLVRFSVEQGQVKGESIRLR